MCARTALFVTIALAALATGGHRARAESDAPYPIWWSPVLELERLDAIEQRFERKFWPDYSDGIPVYRGEFPGDEEASVDSCASYFDLIVKGDYYARTNNEDQVLSFQASTCHAIEMLGEAKPSRESYVSQFVLDETAPDYLPALVDPSASPDFTCRQLLANERRISWREFEVQEFLEIEVADENKMKVLTEGSNLTLEILARADFNGDGIEDLLLRVQTHAVGGSWGTTELTKLSRDAPNDVLYASLHPRFLAYYSNRCEDKYDYPEALREAE